MTYDEKREYQRQLYLWFKRYREDIIREHHGENVLIHDNRVMGYYPDLDTAYKAAKTMGLESGSYLCQDCLHADEDYAYFLPFGARPWEVS